MARKLTNKERIKQIFMSAEQGESEVLLEMAQLIVEMRYWPHGGASEGPSPAKRRGRPAGSRNKGNGKEAPGVGFEPRTE